MTSLAELVTMFRLLTLLDLTSLNEQDDDVRIGQLCRQAQTSLGNVAAVCIAPQFVSLAANMLKDTDIRLATVANFPDGQQSIHAVTQQIQQALADGASEIDVVMPYQQLAQGQTKPVQQFIEKCREVVPEPAIMKVIIESGELKELDMIRTASEIVIGAGANFIKTSTGKTPNGASAEAVRIILDTIRRFPRQDAGIKISGGVRSVAKATQYINITRNLMGDEWISPQHMRFGSSALLEEILNS